jgi:hypothetical protein
LDRVTAKSRGREEEEIQTLLSPLRLRAFAVTSSSTFKHAMTAAAGETENRNSRVAIHPLISSFLPAFLISIAATAWCRGAAGPTLGLFLGSLLMTSLIAPPLAPPQGVRKSWVPACIVFLGTALVWAASLSAADVTVLEWLRCCLVLAAYILSLAGMTTLLAAFGMPRSPAAALTILIALLWLLWPVWLSPWLTQPMADWLVPASPIFAINASLQHLGTWDRAPLAYRTLTVLNQDVPYRLPATIAPACILHTIVGGGCLLLAVWKTKRAEDSKRAIRA